MIDGLAPETTSEEDVAEAAAALEGASPEEILRWAIETYGDDITLACSFGGVSGMVLVDMASRIKPDVSVFYLDTDFLFPETHVLVKETERRYGIKAQAFRPRWSIDAQAQEFGPELWERDPDLCCAIRKVEPNGRALEGKRAWIAGLRRDQGSTRSAIKAVEWDEKFGLVKINPLASWTEEQVWGYIREHDVPYNELHDRGYPSIGCTNCTRAVLAGESVRAGRWSGTSKIECGLHVPGTMPLAFQQER